MTVANIDILINAIQTGGQNTAIEVRSILNALKNEVCKIGEVKLGFFSNSYITANFTSTGLGINEMEGFALANGANGTQDCRKRTPVGFDLTPFVSGDDYSLIGNKFGSATKTLAHDEIPLWKTFLESGAGNSGAADFQNDSNGATTPVPFSLMQPSIVTVFYQRIS